MTSRSARPLALSLSLLVGSSCAMVSAKDRDLGRIELDAGISAQKSGDARLALAQVERALKYDPESAEAWNFHGLVLFLPPYTQPEASIEKFERAIALKPTYSEARVNLGAALMAMQRWAEARDVLDEARRDLIYRDAHLAEGNYAWCLYQLGDKAGAVRHLSAAVSMNQRFCLGYRNLGEILESTGDHEGARRMYERYAASCPRVADSHRRLGLALLRVGQSCGARNAFITCSRLARVGDEASTCREQSELIQLDDCPPPPDPLLKNRDIDVPSAPETERRDRRERESVEPAPASERPAPAETPDFGNDGR